MILAQLPAWLTFANVGALLGVLVAVTGGGYALYQHLKSAYDNSRGIAELRADCGDLRAKYAALELERDANRDRIAALVAQVAALEGEIAAGKVERARLDTTNAQLALTLAVQNSYLRPAGRPSDVTTPAARRRALVVDDDLGTCRSMQVLLEGRGFNTAYVCTCLGALAVLEKDVFDAILLDLHLPDGDALDVLRQVRASGVKTRVVIVTGNNDKEDELAVLRPDGVFLKPADLDKLVAVLRGEVCP